MSVNKEEAMECEPTTNDDYDEFNNVEPGYSGIEPFDCSRTYDHFEPQDASGPSDDLKQDYYPETNDLESKEKNEPLFVIDRTKNFRLNRPIQYEISPNKNKYGKNNFAAQRQNSCWNCNSVNHSLHNCPEPRVQWKIAKNRNAFLMQKQQQQNAGGRNFKNRFGNHKNVRYFIAGTKTLWSDLTPGKLSDNLLKALGVPENGLPVHIYRMREHGYPSGWLEEAREEYSGISIYTKPNECLPLPGRENGINDYFHCNINERKLHEFPGFNAPCPPDVIDEGKKFGCPEYNPEQSLKHMYERLKNGQIGKNGIALSGASSQDTSLASIKNECSTDGNTLDLKTKEELKKGPPSSPEDGEITEDESKSENNDEKFSSNETVPEIDEQNISKSFVSCVDTQNDSQTNVSDSKMTENELFSTPTSKRQFGDVKSEILGTPVLKNFSSYGNRPTHENFAKGMVDMVDHENLPNSIGTFQKLKEILKDVRKTIKDLI
ncbi:zinc finger CCHC domain-containing protein 8 homolog [Rhopalosiphum maidis]|uniref:zinc finger CCHC domain-containing protein 8 homolog n=1 Tax=Rhopalosiphum maidis TaxID=43146 RepID=UPI000F001C95|nr:zinc finger CCHC domain-containing protein 8 homolog [Rhopalosiphum maidis]XP_026816971.1 zinc finger CCHC domain-containing protein 8 homolog [Rhopalosiphum maidis]